MRVSKLITYVKMLSMKVNMENLCVDLGAKGLTNFGQDHLFISFLKAEPCACISCNVLTAYSDFIKEQCYELL